MVLIQSEPKSIKIGTTAIKKVTIRPNGTEKQIRPEIPDYLCFTANTANSTVKLTKTGSPTAVTLETSTDGSTWSTYTFGSTITLSSIGDKVYWRNTSGTTTAFSVDTTNYYWFNATGSMACSGDITSLVNKNCTDTLVGDNCFWRLFATNMDQAHNQITSAPSLPATTLTQRCYGQMFQYCTGLTNVPSLPATTLANYCYYAMFGYCSNLEVLPKLPALTLKTQCYKFMFTDCSKIKLSTTQTGEYQTEYRIPITGTGTTASNALYAMFQSTGGTFTSTPVVNTTYYTSNTLVG